MASGKTLQSTIEISGVLSPSLQSAINNAVGKLADMAEETLDSADAASRLVAEMSAQEDILKTMQKAYAGYVASGEEGSDQARELASRIRTVSGELEENRGSLQAAERAAEQLTAELNGADNDFRKVGDAAETAGNDVENSSDGYTVLKDAIGDLVADGITKATEAFKEMATEGDNALAMLEARTGASADKMEGFEDVMYEVYNANYGESLGDVSEKISTVIQLTDDLDNASLAKVTKNAIALEDVFGFDVKESMRGANSLMDQFGITSDQAFNLIVQGAQNGLNQNDDLMDVINEYAVQFKDAGYTADDMFNMLANGAATGTWSVDKLGDAMKEFNIRMSDGTANDYLKELGVDADSVVAKFNKGGPEAQEAIDTVMKAIKDCDDATLQYQTGVGIFGTMWEDLGADAVFSLMETEGSIDSAKKAMEQMDEAARDTLESSLSQLGRTIKSEVVQPIADKLVPVVKKAVDFTTSKVGPAVDWLVDKLPYLGVALGAVGAIITAMKWGAIVSQFQKIGGAFTSLFSKIGAIPAPVLIVIGVIAALAAAFAYLWKTNEGFRDNVTAIWGELQGSFSQLGGTISSTINQLAPIISQLATTFMTAFSQIAEALIPVLLQIIQAVLPILIQLINMLLPVVLQIIQAILPILIDLINQLLPVVLQIIQMILPFLIQLLNTLLPAIMQIIQAVLPILIDLINQLLPVAIQIIQMILPVLLDLINMLLPVVMQIIQAVLPILIQLINTLLPVIMQIIQAVLPIIQAILPVVIQLIQFLIPILKIVISVISVVAKVITSVLSKAIQFVMPIIQGLTNAFQGVINFISNIFAGKWSSIWQSIVNKFGSIFGTIIGIAKAPINGVISIINKAIGAINKISVKVPDWVPGMGGKQFGFNIPTIPQLATGGFTDGVSIAGEAGMEAVISFDPAYHERNVGIWEKAGQLLGVLGNQEQGAGLTSKAGELLTLDDFSLGSLADGTSVVIYYDFSGFTWSPQIHANGSSDNEDNIMAKLKAHEAEFFDWLEEFIKMREVAQYA